MASKRTNAAATSATDNVNAVRECAIRACLELVREFVSFYRFSNRRLIAYYRSNHLYGIRRGFVCRPMRRLRNFIRNCCEYFFFISTRFRKKIYAICKY